MDQIVRNIQEQGVSSCGIVDKHGYMVNGFNCTEETAARAQMVMDLGKNLQDLLKLEGLESISIESNQNEYMLSNLKNEHLLLMKKKKED